MNKKDIGFSIKKIFGSISKMASQIFFFMNATAFYGKRTLTMCNYCICNDDQAKKWKNENYPACRKQSTMDMTLLGHHYFLKKRVRGWAIRVVLSLKVFHK